MASNVRFAERIGKVFFPEADTIDGEEDFTPNPEGPIPGPGIPGLPGTPEIPIKWPPFEPGLLWPRFCFTSLKTGCYTIGFAPTGSKWFATRYRGTLRVESFEKRRRISGDLYAHRLIDDIIVQRPFVTARLFGPIRGADMAADDAADTGGTIPIYARRKYHSYLKGTGARFISYVTRGATCAFTLDFDEFVYNHPTTGFSGSFNSTPTRSIRFVLRHTGTPDYYSGEAYDGTTLIGNVSIRWVSPFFRRAALQINTLQGAVTPPASVGASTMSSIFADVGWDVAVTDAGTVKLPAALSGVNINSCWSNANLHTLMSSVPGYNPTDLDSVWRVHLVAVPAALGCGRGVMFDSAFGADPNAVPREGSGTFSHDGYPATEVPDGMGGSHYDGVANQQQRNVPRAFLRSATHEVGHAFNQIHQGFELGNDNSIMTPTPGVATVIGTGGTFPDAINLGFNDTVKRHLRHLPDPAVRPGAMDFFGSAVAAPEASDVAWLESLAVSVTPESDRASLGQPVEIAFALTNTGDAPILVPETLDLASLTVRINVTDPTGRITFMRPPDVASCPRLSLVELAPGRSVKGTTTIFWGRDGFAFETPGRHTVEVIVLWNIAGVPIAGSGEADVFVTYPITQADNTVAALLLHPEVGRAVATGRAWAIAPAAERIRQVMTTARNHPAVRAVARVANVTEPGTARGTRARGRKPRARKARARR